MKEYFVFINNSEQGPFTLAQLASMNITPTTDVWCEGMSDWAPASNVPELASIIQHLSTPVAATMPPQHETTTASSLPPQRNFDTLPQSQPEQRKRSGCFLWGLLIVFITLIVLAMTVPSRQTHIETVKDVTSEWINATVNDKIGGNILGEVAKWVGASGTDFLIDQIFHYDNYFVCSVGHIEIGTKSKMISFGILGHVFTFDKDDINAVIEKELKGNDETQVSTSHDKNDITEQPIEDEIMPVPEETAPQGQDGNQVKDMIDTMTQHIKDEAVKAAKEWAKKKIDEM